MQMLAGQNVYAPPRNKAAQGPLRVWLHNQSFPGLAMTRSLGDGHAKRAGVIAEPELDSMQFDSNDITVVPKYIVLATDGLWDVMSNENVATFLFDIKNYNKSAQKLAESLGKECRQRWLQQASNFGVVSEALADIDDITIIVIKLEFVTD